MLPKRIGVLHFWGFIGLNLGDDWISLNTATPILIPKYHSPYYRYPQKIKVPIIRGKPTKTPTRRAKALQKLGATSWEPHTKHYRGFGCRI